MEIRCPVHGGMVFSDSEVAILDSPAYQRLRFIKQLGFTEFSFPGGTHNRYIHSIGACHLAGLAFDSIFANYPFSTSEVKQRLRQTLRLAALLHDVGHGPLSHTTEEVMPLLKDLNVKAYQHKTPKMQGELMSTAERKATHEDYTIKFITDSPLSQTLSEQFADIHPLHIAGLVDRSLKISDDFFIDNGLNLRPILSQLVSSELDVDRMDYLERDAYFCGTNYGKVELDWLISNLTYHEVNGALHLALNRRAIYTFEDFLLSRHHMYLMVYFHHKSIVYEEILLRYLTSEDCAYFLPADINEYLKYTDYALYQHLGLVTNRWARAIANKRPHRMLIEMHTIAESQRAQNMKAVLEQQGMDVIYASSKSRLSKYHATSGGAGEPQIYLVDQYDKTDKPVPLAEGTQIFQKYEETRVIERFYVHPDQFNEAEKILVHNKL